MKTFNVWGSFTVDVSFDVEAESEEAAQKEAEEKIKSICHIPHSGGINASNPGFDGLNIDEEDES